MSASGSTSQSTSAYSPQSPPGGGRPTSLLKLTGVPDWSAPESSVTPLVSVAPPGPFGPNVVAVASRSTSLVQLSFVDTGSPLAYSVSACVENVTPRDSFGPSVSVDRSHSSVVWPGPGPSSESE